MTATDLMFPASLHAAAKINLFLRITGKRTDGYHTLESGVVFTEFGDRITINRAAADKICLTGPFAGDLMKDSGDNICASCLAKFRQAGGVVEPLKIVIEKNIPVGAGLGGGSSDAAALLRHLNQHATTPLSPDALYRLALHLGADVPVCLNMASAHVSGIGEIISPLAVKNAGSILLANPGRALATGDVFKSLTDADMTGDRLASHLPPDGATPSELARYGNDLLTPACQLMPEIETLLTMLAGQEGADTVGMSGSGATCFAIYSSRTACEAAAGQLLAKNIWAVATRII